MATVGRGASKERANQTTQTYFKKGNNRRFDQCL